MGTKSTIEMTREEAEQTMRDKAVLLVDVLYGEGVSHMTGAALEDALSDLDDVLTYIDTGNRSFSNYRIK